MNSSKKPRRRRELNPSRYIEYTATRFRLQALNLLPCVSRYYIHAALPTELPPHIPDRLSDRGPKTCLINLAFTVDTVRRGP